MIDRDYNGSINILKIIEEYLRSRTRPKYLITEKKESSIEIKKTKAPEKGGRLKKCTSLVVSITNFTRSVFPR